MKKKFFALEELDVTQPEPATVEEAQTETVLTQVEAAVTDAEATVEATDDVASVTDTLDEMAANPEKAVEIATEHLLKSIGMARMSMESFRADKHQIKLSSKISIAQEGMFSRLGNSVKLLFTTEERILTSLHANLEKIKQRGAIETTITEPGWGRSFSQIAKSVITPADALKVIKEYRKIVESNEMLSLLKDFESVCDELAKELSRSRFIADDNAIANINKLNEKIGDFNDRTAALVANDTKTAKNDPDFQPLKESEAEALAKEAIASMTSRKFEAQLDNLYNALDNTNWTIISEAQIRLMNAGAKDIRASTDLVNKINRSLTQVLSIAQRKARLCFACANYIKASTVKA